MAVRIIGAGGAGEVAVQTSWREGGSESGEKLENRRKKSAVGTGLRSYYGFEGRTLVLQGNQQQTRG